jgi:hypothetical protein
LIELFLSKLNNSITFFKIFVLFQSKEDQPSRKRLIADMNSVEDKSEERVKRNRKRKLPDQDFVYDDEIFERKGFRDEWKIQVLK